MSKKEAKETKETGDAKDAQGQLPPPPPVQEAAPAQPDPAAMAALAAQRDDLLARLQRVSADYLNYQKRAHRDVAQAREFANEELIRSLLPILDDMERALQAASAACDNSTALLEGMCLVHHKLTDTLGRFGLKPILVQAGQHFSPDRHMALMQEPSKDFPPQTILRELQRGYELKGRTIRPASVVVSTPAEPPPREAPPNDRETQE